MGILKKLFICLLSILALSTFLVACQGGEQEASGTEGEEVVHTEEEHEGEEHNHDEANSNDHEAPEDIKIEGIADHYHTGDAIELTAVLDEEPEYDHWHWYSRENTDDEWETVSDQESDTFTGEAKIDGLEIKAVLFNDDHEAHVQSAPVEVVIDDHHGEDEESQQIYEGYFEDSQIEDRELSDWEGDWQSVYPYLEAGDLDEVFEHKAEEGDMTAKEYKKYYTVGYETDVNRIIIDEDNVVTFFENGEETSGEYEYDGYEILTYEAGNRGVRFIYELVGEEHATIHSV